MVFYYFMRCVAVLLFLGLGHVLGNGKGPVGLYIIDPKGHYALVADSNFNAVFIIDLFLGGVVTQRLLDKQPWMSVTAVSSCPACDFIYLTSNHGAGVWRLDLPMPVLQGIQEKNLTWFSTVPLIARPSPSISAARLMVITDNGKFGYITDYNNKKIWKFDVETDKHVSRRKGNQTQMQLTELLTCCKDRTPPTGMTLTNRNSIIVSAEKMVVEISIDPKTEGNIIGQWDSSNIIRNKRKNRQTVLDPAQKDLFITVGHDQSGTFGMSVDTMPTGQGQSSQLLAGSPTSARGWKDGHGKNHAKFSRPHDMALAGLKKEWLVLTDMDSRVMRRVALTGPGPRGSGIDRRTRGDVFSIIYDEDGLFDRLYITEVPSTGSREGHFRQRPHVLPPHDITGKPSQLPWIDSNTSTHRPSVGTTTCEAKGGRLCRPSEVRNYFAKFYEGLFDHNFNHSHNPLHSLAVNRSRHPSPSFTRTSNSFSVWTSKVCESCWMLYPNEGKCKDNEGLRRQRGSSPMSHTSGNNTAKTPPHPKIEPSIARTQQMNKIKHIKASGNGGWRGHGRMQEEVEESDGGRRLASGGSWNSGNYLMTVDFSSGMFLGTCTDSANSPHTVRDMCCFGGNPYRPRFTH